MSFYDDASLAFLPSGAAGKDGKAYSIKPTNGDGDFTFSRGSNLSATRVGADGLIEKGRENLLLQSNQFDTTWSAVSGTITSGQSGYDGSNDAWLFERTAAGGSMRQSVSLSGVQTRSVYAKAGSLNWMAFVSGGSLTAYFDLQNGALGTISAAAIEAKIESVGNGWYRCSLTQDVSLTEVRMYPALGDFDLSANGSIYIQDAQVEIGLAATDYIESGASTGKAGLLEDEPRFDYSGGATCPSLLLEPSRTNSLGQTEYFDGYYAKFASGITYDTNTSETLSPEGLYNATKLISSTNNEQQAIYKNITTATPTFTCYAKAGEFDTFALKLSGSVSCNFTLTGDGSIDYNTNTSDKSITPVGNGWYRCSISATTNSVYAWIAINGSSTQGDGTSGIYIYGAQLESGSYPTSYIPNHSGGTITRGAEVPSNPSATSVIGQTEGTIFIDFLYESSLSGNRFSISDGGPSNWIFIATPESGTSSRFYIRVNSSVIIDVGASSYFTDGQRYKLALAYKSGDWAAYGNGAQLYSGTNTIPSFSSPMDTINFKSYNPNDVITEREKVNQVLFFDTRLSNADLATLTTI